MFISSTSVPPRGNLALIVLQAKSLEFVHEPPNHTPTTPLGKLSLLSPPEYHALGM